MYADSSVFLHCSACSNCWMSETACLFLLSEVCGQKCTLQLSHCQFLMWLGLHREGSGGEGRGGEGRGGEGRGGEGRGGEGRGGEGRGGEGRGGEGRGREGNRMESHLYYTMFM